MLPKCVNCKFWKKDYGTFTITGWTKMDKQDGYCYYFPVRIEKKSHDMCSYFQS